MKVTTTYPVLVGIEALTEMVGEMTSHYKQWGYWQEKTKGNGGLYTIDSSRKLEEASATTTYANVLRIMTGLDWYSRMQELTGYGREDFDPDRIKYTLCDMYEDGTLPKYVRDEDYLD